MKMKTDIILSGVGGQGILSIAASIGVAALNNKLFLKQAEVHGMSQRGGAVQSNLRISDKEIMSDLIPMGQCDLILSVEPMEVLRYLPWLKKGGWLVSNSVPFINIAKYPNINEIIAEIEKQPNHVILDAEAIAREIGSVRSSNMVMLGAASPFIDISVERFREGISQIFTRKGEEIVKINQAAFEAGRNIALKKIN